MLPSLFILIALSWVYLAYGNAAGRWPGMFYGLKPAVTALVVHAAHRIGTRALKNGWLWGIAAAAFVAIFALDAPFPLIVLARGARSATSAAGACRHIFTPRGGGHGPAAKQSYGPALIDDDTPTPAARPLHPRAAGPSVLVHRASACGPLAIGRPEC